MTSHGFTDRDQLLDNIKNGQADHWDMIIIGGGITGAGVLREATRKGYRVLLLEQNDFAWGTSSRSSKMVHGGLRYLAAGDFTLTKHSIQERERLLSEAPGLVDRMGFYFTLREGKFPGRWSFTALLWIYDFFAKIKNHHFINKKQLLSNINGLAQDNLVGGYYYTDAVTDDARLVLRVLQESIADGGHALNYVKVKNLIVNNDQVSGVNIYADGYGEMSLSANVVVNATGAWADRLRNQVNPEVRVRPLRGSHLLFEQHKLPVNDALTFFHAQDKRGVFIYPWEGTTIVGTSDLDHLDDLDQEPKITQEEVTYLMQVIHDNFPDSDINTDDIISTYAGVRPVVGSEKSKDPSKERRDHAVWSDKGLISVCGGKLTTFRLIALDALAAAKQYLPELNASQKQAASKKTDVIFTQATINASSLIPEKPTWAAQLLGRYGQAAKSLLKISAENEQLPIDKTKFSLAQCRWALRNEAVIHLDDLLLRRTRLGLVLSNGGEKIFASIEKLCREELDWDEQKWATELARYQDIWQRCYSTPHNDN